MNQRAYQGQAGIPRSVGRLMLTGLIAIGIWAPGTLRADGPVVTLSARSMNFGQVIVGAGIAPNLAVFLTNTGTATLHISSITVSDGFINPNPNCPTGDYPPGSGCQVQVVFFPQQPGVVTGELTIVDNAPDSPQVVTLSGKGTYLKFSPPNLGFGSVFPGQRQSRTVSVTNTGSAAIGINGVATGGPAKSEFLIEGNTCGSSIVGGASCDLTVTFAPSVLGKDAAAVLLGNTQAGSPNAIALAGNATQVDFTPATLDYGKVNQGPGPSKTVTVTNLGDAPLNFLNFQITGSALGSYTIQQNTCTGPLAPQGSCTITVQVFADRKGPRIATLSISDDGAASPQGVLLVAVGG